MSLLTMFRRKSPDPCSEILRRADDFLEIVEVELLRIRGNSNSTKGDLASRLRANVVVADRALAQLRMAREITDV
jgi:hypothetical protein